MLQIQAIRENTEKVIKALNKRGFKSDEIIPKILDLDASRRETQTELDQVLAESNQLSESIGKLFKSGKASEAEPLKAKSGELKEKSKELNEKLHEVANELESLLYQVPNTPNEIVPEGKTPEDNEVVFSKGEIPSLHAGAKPHWELASDYELIDFELGVKISGAGFPVYKGKGARLQRALTNFFLDQNIAAGYAEVQPPHLINEASGYGTGQLPDKEGQMYHVTGDDLLGLMTLTPVGVECSALEWEVLQRGEIFSQFCVMKTVRFQLDATGDMTYQTGGLRTGSS